MKYFIMGLTLMMLSGCNCKNLPDFVSSGCYAEEKCDDCESLNTPVREEE